MSVSSITGSPQSELPEEILLEIFRNLPPQTLAGRISLVCKDFRRLAQIPSFYEPYVKIIGKAEYAAIADESLGLNFDGLSPIDMKTAIAKTIPFFGRLDKEGRGIEGDAGVAILDIPGNLSFPKLGQIGTRHGMRHFAGDCSHAHFHVMKTDVQKAYRVMITRNVLTESRNLLPQSRACIPIQMNCLLPKALEIGALFLATFLSSPKDKRVCLYGYETSTLCSDPADLIYNKMGIFLHQIGDFSGVSGNFLIQEAFPYCFDDCGVAAARVLNTINF